MKREDLKREVSFVAVTSRGPGGQNVNKVSSAAVIKWNPDLSSCLTAAQKQLVKDKLTYRMTNLGEIQIRSDEYRDLPRNKERCLEKLISLIQEALHVQKKRKPTRPTAASKRRRLESKSHRSQIKKDRKSFRD